LIDWLSRV